MSKFLETESNSDELKKSLKATADGLRKAFSAALEEIGISVTRDAIRGAPIKTGELRRRITYNWEFQGDNGFVEAGVGVPGTGSEPLIYAEIQDVGGIVRPVKSQKLAIPVWSKFTTASGVSGVSARDVISNPGQWGLKSTFTRENSILGVTEAGETVTLFARKREVVVPGTRYLSNPADQMERGGALRIIQRKIEQELKK